MKYKQVVFFSNPFGFGPSGKILAVMGQLVTLLPGNVDVVYAASKKCLEPLDQVLRDKIMVEEIDERNPNEVEAVLNKYDNPLVVVCLNRVVINVAKDLGLDALFIDSLTWLWKEIPRDYLRANTYYAYDIFSAEEKVQGLKNIKLIPPILGSLPKLKEDKKDWILVHVGGFTNPLVPGFSKSYLVMLVNAINSVIKEKRTTKMIITGGSEPLDFLKNFIKKKRNVLIHTMSRPRFLSTLNESSFFVTTPGLTATLEAFAFKVPTAFLPPTNLSQWKLLKLLTEFKLATRKVEWEDVCSLNSNFGLLSEKEAISKLLELSDVVYANSRLRAELVEKIRKVLLTVDRSFATFQNSFVRKLGVNGAEVIVRDILEYLQR